MPNMCPAIIVKNQYLAQAFKNEQNMEFILVSFDYDIHLVKIIQRKLSPTLIACPVPSPDILD